MSEWCLENKKTECKSLSPILTRLVANRGIRTDKEARTYFCSDISNLHSPSLLKDMDKGTSLVVGAIKDGKKIRVIGDYDIDGVCASVILYRGLKSVGADVSVAIPHRVKDGYGLNERLIREASAESVDLVLTCDNGIGAIEQTELAHKLGMTVVITDHHEVHYTETESGREYSLPDADAIIDPKQSDCNYPFDGICGAFVAYKFIRYIYENKLLGDEYEDVYTDTDFDNELLQYAAFATVGDIMELCDENRVLVKNGLNLMSARPARGIAELIRVQGLCGKQITTYHLGFVIGPCINAAGRLDSAMRAFDLLTCENDIEAEKMANDLRELNESRKSMTDTAVKDGKEKLTDDMVEVLFLPECHESVAGIVAGRLKEYCHKPVLVATRTDGKILKGSARSIPAYPLYDEMTKVGDLFLGFGGHSQAAGFSLLQSNFTELRKRLNANCVLSERDVQEEVLVDMVLPLCDATGELADIMDVMEPFGTGNRKPMFMRTNLRLLRMETMGKTGKYAKLIVADGGVSHELVTFKHVEELTMEVCRHFDLKTSQALIGGLPVSENLRISVVYSVGWNEFRGERRVQLTVEDLKLV